MKMSSACTAPNQPTVTADERQHVRYYEYASYRAAMTCQLVRAMPFDAWLRTQEEFENARERVFEASPKGVLKPGWYKNKFAAGSSIAKRFGPFATQAEAEAA
jgi:hypothetical protein